MSEVELNIPIPETDLRIYGLLRDVPKAPIVVFVHCFTAGMNSTEYYVGARVLEQAGFASYRFNLQGYQDDARKIVDCTLDVYASDLDVVVAELRRRLPGRPVIAVGHSLGGMTIMASATKDFDGIVLWDPTHPECWDDGITLDNDESLAWEPSLQLFRRLGGVDELVGRTLLESYRLRTDADDFAQGLSTPMLTLLSGSSGDSVRRGYRRYHDIADGPKDLRIVEGADHSLMNGESLSTVLDETTGWLDELFCSAPSVKL